MLPRMHLHVVEASTSGNTEYVTHVLADYVGSTKHEARSTKPVMVTMVRAEEATAEDLLKGDVLLLACGTWNTGGREGQLNPHMHELLLKRAKAIDLARKPCAVIALGDARYRYTANAAVHLEDFVKRHGGRLLLPSLQIVNEPYGQEGKIRVWGEKLVKKLTKSS